MNINEGIVDFDNPQWVGRRLREYTIRTAFNIVTSTTPIDQQYQTHYYLMGVCNSCLYEALKKRESEIIERMPFPELEKLGIDRIMEHDSLSQVFPQNRYASSEWEKRINFETRLPFFEIYHVYNNLEEADVVRSLLKKYGISYPAWYEKYTTQEKMSNTGYIVRIKENEKPYGCYQLFNLRGGSRIFCHCLLSGKPYPLLNRNLLLVKNKVPVFLVDSFWEAKGLQDKYFEAYSTWFKESQIQLWKTATDGNYFVSPVVDAINNVDLYQMRSNDNPCVYMNLFTNIVWSSWFGGYDFLNQCEWTALKEHDVYFFQMRVAKQTAIEHFLQLDVALRNSGVSNFYLVWLEKITDMENLENNPFELLDRIQVLDEAAQAGLSLDDTQSDELAVYLRQQNRFPRKETQFLINPIIRLNSFNVISGIPGSGKSFLALGLGAAMAAGGRLFNDWKVERKANVVYVADDEMDKDILDDRRKMLHKLYPGHESNFIIESVHRIDLLDESKQAEIKKMINQYFLKMDKTRPCVVIFDHLSKLTNTLGDQKEKWPLLRAWFEDLNQDKITVILIHHEYTSGKMTGTVLISADADTHIHVNRSPEDYGTHALGMEIKVPKNKAAMDQRTSYPIILDMNRSVCWREPKKMGSQGMLAWKSMPLEEKIALVREARTRMNMAEISDMIRRSKSFLEKFCKTHGISSPRNTHPVGSHHPSATQEALSERI